VPVIGLDHVQLAMPANGEVRAREFYGDLLGLTEIPKPPHLARRGGLWSPQRNQSPPRRAS